MSASGALALPGETWRHVFKFFECPPPLKEWWMHERDLTSIATLMSLCLTCREFNEIAQPLLFRNIFFSGEEPAVSCFKLVSILLDRPSLGLHVRSLSFGLVDPEDIPFEGVDFEDFNRKLEERLHLPHTFKQALDQYFLEHEYHDPAVIGLCLMPNLQLLDFICYWDSWHVIWMLSGQPNAKCDQSQSSYKLFERSGDEDETLEFKHFGLPKLRELRIQSTGNEGATGIREIEAIFLHTGVEIIRSIGIDWRERVSLQKQVRNRQSAVRVLELRECVINRHGLKDAFDCFPNLEDLLVHLGDARRRIGVPVLGDDDADSPDNGILNVLRDHGQQLATLYLHTSKHENWYPPEPGAGRLASLPNLRHLACLAADLVGDAADRTSLQLQDMIPATLETLYIHSARHRYLSNQDPYLGLRGVLFGELLPSLHEIKIAGCFENGKKIGPVPGWNKEIITEHLWKRPVSTGYHQDIVILTRSTQNKSSIKMSGLRREGFLSNSHELL